MTLTETNLISFRVLIHSTGTAKYVGACQISKAATAVHRFLKLSYGHLKHVGGESDVAVHGVETVHPLKVRQKLDQLHLHAAKDAAHHFPHLLCHLPKINTGTVPH